MAPRLVQATSCGITYPGQIEISARHQPLRSLCSRRRPYIFANAQGPVTCSPPKWPTAWVGKQLMGTCVGSCNSLRRVQDTAMTCTSDTQSINFMQWPPFLVQDTAPTATRPATAPALRNSTLHTHSTKLKQNAPDTHPASCNADELVCFLQSAGPLPHSPSPCLQRY